MLRLVKAEAPTFLRFALVGGTGFAVDAIVLSLLHYVVGLDPFSARVVSMSSATFTTWRLNRAHTFGASERSQAHEGMRYATVAALAAGINYGVYAAALLLWRGIAADRRAGAWLRLGDGVLLRRLFARRIFRPAHDLRGAELAQTIAGPMAGTRRVRFRCEAPLRGTLTLCELSCGVSMCQTA